MCLVADSSKLSCNSLFHVDVVIVLINKQKRSGTFAVFNLYVISSEYVSFHNEDTEPYKLLRINNNSYFTHE